MVGDDKRQECFGHFNMALLVVPVAISLVQTVCGLVRNAELSTDSLDEPFAIMIFAAAIYRLLSEKQGE